MRPARNRRIDQGFENPTHRVRPARIRRLDQGFNIWTRSSGRHSVPGQAKFWVFEVFQEWRLGAYFEWSADIRLW